MFLYSLCELAADFLNLSRRELGLKPPKELVSKTPKGFVFGKHRWRYLVKDENEDGHVLVVGGAGSGKSTCIAIPTLKAWRKRVFAIDIKGELVRETGHLRPTLKVFNPLDPAAFGYNPFFLLKYSLNIVEDLQELAFAIIAKPPSTREPFWVDGARNLLTGALLHFYHQGYTFIEIMTLVQSKSVAELVYEIGESETEVARLFVSQFFGMDVKTLVGIFAELSNRIMVFATDSVVRDAFSRQKIITPFDLEKGFDIYLQIPEDRLDQWQPMVAPMLNQFIKCSERRPLTGATPILYYLAEFPRLGQVEAVNGLATLRGRKIVFCLEAQSLAQLDDIYGRDKRKVITDNCSYKAILSATDVETQDYFSRLVGTYERARVSRGQNFEGEDTDIIKGNSRNVTTEEKRVIKPETFAILKKHIALTTPHGFCWAKKAPYYIKHPFYPLMG